ncbi:MAG: flavodoxin family protein [Candidatus Lokiarchaeota archaeon]|nr:flavodoxin family protein [Candidatus Lokiarchaeota archaeon]
MLKILIIHGSPQKRQTYEATMEFLKELGNQIETEVKHVFLLQEHLELCRGCATCITHGEDRCSFKDGLKEIHTSMQDADVVIITTPIYALQVTALVKNFLERSSYILHRPCFFGKWFMSISTQAYSGDKEVAQYLANVMHLCGFNIIPSLRITIEQKKEISKKIRAAVNHFQAIERKTGFPHPTWKDFMMFRVRRSVMNSKSYEDKFPCDVEYFREKNWFKTHYYYDIHINPLMKIMGKFFDSLGRRIGAKDDERQLKEVK